MSKTDRSANTVKTPNNRVRIAMGIQGRNILSDDDLKKVLGDDFLEEELNRRVNS
ncbi:hypothetical protein [uncultured Microscilla sp.]|uniref:hypothetical protein n=1 Tax=uncultured Microscilla sp. TaxID=432653 RepID=UPI0026261EA9|nr:hypothetical protein [uncultured Microscilla sp.]